MAAGNQLRPLFVTLNVSIFIGGCLASTGKLPFR
jgi:hypothetical protein